MSYSGENTVTSRWFGSPYRLSLNSVVMTDA